MIDNLKTSSDLRNFKGRYVRKDERIKAQNARKADYEQLLKELEVEKI